MSPQETFDSIQAVDLAAVPVMTKERHIARKEQAALARKLFKKLNIIGVSVTTPTHSMASTVDIRLPREQEDMTGFEDKTYSELPGDHPVRLGLGRRGAAREKLAAILGVAFPNHDDRSDSMTDYYDRKWHWE